MFVLVGLLVLGSGCSGTESAGGFCDSTAHALKNAVKDVMNHDHPFDRSAFIARLRAIDLSELAVAAKENTPEWIYAYFLFAQGLAEYRQRHFETAITLMEGDAGKVMGPCPQLVIAMAHYRLGDSHEAHDTLAAALKMADWDLSQVRSHEHWIWHIVRREAEATISFEPQSAAANDPSVISKAP